MTLEPFTGVIDAILEADRQVPRKQRHTAKRIFERLRDEHGFDGQYTIVKDYVRERRRRTQEMTLSSPCPTRQAWKGLYAQWRPRLWRSPVVIIGRYGGWSGRRTTWCWTCPTAMAAS